MHIEQNAPFLQLFHHKHSLPHSSHTPPPPMNILGPILYNSPPWVTQCFPWWFKWGFKEFWKVRFSQMTKVCWDSQTLSLWWCTIERDYLEPTLQVLCLNSFRSTSDPGPSRSGFDVQRSDLPPLYWGAHHLWLWYFSVLLNKMKMLFGFINKNPWPLLDLVNSF